MLIIAVSRPPTSPLAAGSAMEGASLKGDRRVNKGWVDKGRVNKGPYEEELLKIRG